jgi:hypothetical protein
MPTEEQLQPPQHQEQQPGSEEQMTPKPKFDDSAHKGSDKLLRESSNYYGW